MDTHRLKPANRPIRRFFKAALTPSVPDNPHFGETICPHAQKGQSRESSGSASFSLRSFHQTCLDLNMTRLNRDIWRFQNPAAPKVRFEFGAPAGIT